MTEPTSQPELENDDSKRGPAPQLTGGSGTVDHAHDSKVWDVEASDGSPNDDSPAAPLPEAGMTEDHSHDDEIREGSLLVRNRYKVLECKRGGMGVVYKCLDTYMDNSVVALKTVQTEGEMNERDVRRMQWNFRMVHGLTHDHIVQVNTLERDEARRQWFLAMDWVDGEDLESILRKRRDEGGRLPVESVIRILRQMAEALDYAHNKKGRKVIHRDVKCANIMVKPDGDAMLIDFGIAKRAHSIVMKTTPEGDGTMTTMATTSWDGVVTTGNPFAGTPAYQSPEQWEGKDATAASDLYSLAVTAYRCLVGHLPFINANEGLLQELVLHAPMPESKMLPADANAVLAKGMAKKPEERYKSCSEFVNELERAMKIAQPLPSTAPQPPTITEEDFYLYLGKISKFHDACENREWDRGQTFGEHLDEFTQKWDAASNARMDHNYRVAYSFLQKVESEWQWLERNEPLRAAAKEMQSKAAEARSNIAPNQPELYAKELLAEADKVQANAEKSLESGAFEAASAGFEAVMEIFADAGRIAIEEHVRQVEGRISESLAEMRFDDAKTAVGELLTLDDAKGRKRAEEVKDARKTYVERLEKSIADEVEQAHFAVAYGLVEQLKAVDPKGEAEWRGAVDDAKNDYIQELDRRLTDAFEVNDFETAEAAIRDLSGVDDAKASEWTAKISSLKEEYVRDLEASVEKAVGEGHFDDAREVVERLAIIEPEAAEKRKTMIRIRELELSIEDALERMDFNAAESVAGELAPLSDEKSSEWIGKVSSAKEGYVRELESSVVNAVIQGRFDDARDMARRLADVDAEAAERRGKMIRIRELELSIENAVSGNDFKAAEAAVGELSGLDGDKASEHGAKVRAAKEKFVDEQEASVEAAIAERRFEDAEKAVQRLAVADAEAAEAYAAKIAEAKAARVHELSEAIWMVAEGGRFTDAFGMLLELRNLDEAVAKETEEKLKSAVGVQIGLLEQSVSAAVAENRFDDAEGVVSKVEVLDKDKALKLKEFVRKSKAGRIQELKGCITECVRQKRFEEAREAARQLEAVDASDGRNSLADIQKTAEKHVVRLTALAKKALRRHRIDEARAIIRELAAVDAEEAKKLEAELETPLPPPKPIRWRLWASCAAAVAVLLVAVIGWRLHVRNEVKGLAHSLQSYYQNGYNRNWSSGQTVGEHLSIFEDNYAKGREAWDANNVGVARDYFRKADEERVWFDTNIPLRETATKAMQTADAKKRNAENGMAKVFANDDYMKADAIYAEAKRQYEAADFTGAAVSFEKAGQAFGEAVDVAVAGRARQLESDISTMIEKGGFDDADAQITALDGLGKKYADSVEQLKKKLADARRRKAVADAMIAARGALVGGDWSLAQAKAEEILQLEADNVDAKTIKIKALEERVSAYIGNADFTQAENLIKDLEGFDMQKAQDLRMRLAEAKKRITVADFLKAAQNAIAEGRWTDAQAKANEVLALEPENAEAKIVKIKALEERVSESIHDADFIQAEKLIAELEKLDFQKAQLWKELLAKMQKINDLLVAAKAALDNQNWQKAQDKADDVLKLDADNTEAKEIKAKAQEQLKPTARIVAKVNGKDVNATLELNGAKYTTPAIVNEDLTQGQVLKGMLTYQRDDDYRSEIDTVVNWLGMKEITVELKKVDRYKVVTLPGDVELKLVKVEAGSFMMGSNDGDSDEKPVHKVTLTKDFWLGETEVTQSQYEVIVGRNPSCLKKGGNYPVESVSWNDAMEFCRKLTDMERKAGRISGKEEYTLPTEAQWEYAARGGKKTKGYKYSGSDNLDEVGWYDYNSERSTHPVRQKKANELGLYDMNGNVWDWCRDSCEYGIGVVTDAYKEGIVDPWCREGLYRVVRGGAWYCNMKRCRSAYRGYGNPSDGYSGIGFRLALVSVDSDASATSQPAVPSESGTKAIKVPSESGTKATVHSSATETSVNGIEYKTIQLPGGVELKMVKVEAGSFMMGSNDGESDEKPVHKVILTKDFWLGETEVTQAQYETVMGKNPSNFKKGDNYPVEYMSWNDAMEFCRKLTELERTAGRLPSGYEYTLPTEAQWEYAARGGNKSKGYKYSGGDNLGEIGWYWGNSDQSTHLVGQKKPNELGLYDMSGNVWEWCRDSCKYKNGVITDTYKDGVVDPLCRSGSWRVLRGGSWDDPAALCRSAIRGGYAPSLRDDDLGFRVALVPVQ